MSLHVCQLGCWQLILGTKVGVQWAPTSDKLESPPKSLHLNTKCSVLCGFLLLLQMSIVSKHDTYHCSCYQPSLHLSIVLVVYRTPTSNFAVVLLWIKDHMPKHKKLCVKVALLPAFCSVNPSNNTCTCPHYFSETVFGDCDHLSGGRGVVVHWPVFGLIWLMTFAWPQTHYVHTVDFVEFSRVT